MCDPVSATMMVVSTGLNIYTGIQQSQAQKDAGAASKKYYYGVADQVDQEARLLGDQGSRDIITVEQASKGVQAKQRTAMAASGIGAGSVTAEEVLKDTINQANLDELAIRYDADLAVWDKKNEAKSLRVAGDNALQAGNINANTTLLTSASTVASKWLDYGSAAGWGLSSKRAPSIGTRNTRSSNSKLDIWGGGL